ncbi:MAG TPA: UvrD-helicase domain-containing protein [Bacteroidales bacterium]|nr:UvrD-helicase domain-containing protein [Bacteroidales bacterium]
MNKLLDNLNDSQRDAVLYNTGPSLVIAGAGSGKTRVLTHKIACLLQEGFKPWSILALTFTNKAAREMKERIANLVDPEAASRLWMGTFHSLFFRILRAESEAIGFPNGFTIYDTADSKSLLKTILKEMGLDDKIYKVNAVYGRISAAKNDLISPEAYAANGDMIKQDIQSKRPLIKEIYQRYVNRCRLASAMDFDDLLFQTNVLFRDHLDILAKYQHQFQFILVDEYQDTNFSQYLIVKKLAELHHRVCLVGDDSQSIYSFRGANIENILNFKKTYPEGKIYKLEQNYRSTKTIVNAANSLISKNKGQIQKKVFSDKETGLKIRVMTAYSDLEEGLMVANKINELRLSVFDSFNDFVILYRTNAQSRIFEEALRKRNLPYRVYGGLSFYQRKEIKDVIAYLRLILNAADEEAFKRIINYPARGIGDTTLQKLIHAASEKGVSLWAVLSDIPSFSVQFNSGTAKKLENFRQLIEYFHPLIGSKNVFELTQQLLVETGIKREVEEDQSPETLSRKENIQALLGGMNEFVLNRIEEGNDAVFLTDYLQEVSLLTDQDESNNQEGERITLMTIHAAKGLEFKNVFVTGLEEDLFPSLHSLESEKDLEEERRLLYVAITRAERICVLSYSKSRFRNGTSNFTRPSRFLKDLDPSLLDYPLEFSSFETSDNFQSRTFPSKSQMFEEKTVTPSMNRVGMPVSSTGKPLMKVKSQPATSSPLTAGTGFASDVTDLKVGSTIAHERFGKGVVISLEGSGDNAKVEVEFETSGYKKLLLKFARFTILS